MKVYNDKVALQRALAPLRESGTVGFVPTMGALHQGHIALIKQAAKENPFTVVSIFVNPTQFNNQEDLKAYPRTLDTDLACIKEAIGEDILIFAPSVAEMYKENLVTQNFDFDGLDRQMEGAFRPGHFDGVGTIVSKLFDFVKPNRAYFGEKDFQQLQIIRKLVAKLELPIDIIGCPIVRDASGLAKSSRNQLLSEEERDKASLIYSVLNKVNEQFSGENAMDIKKYVADSFQNHPLFKLDYFEIADEETLHSLKQFDKQQNYRAFIAVYAGDVRLIDNIQLN